MEMTDRPCLIPYPIQTKPEASSYSEYDGQLN